MRKNYSKLLSLILFFALISSSVQAQQADLEKRLEIIKQSQENLKTGQLMSPDLAEIAEGKLSIFNQNKYIIRNGEVFLIARCKSNVNALADELRTLGAKKIKKYNRTVTFRLAVDKVMQLNNCTELSYARPEIKPHAQVGSVENEAFESLKVNLVSKRFGLTGKGIRIGVLSDSYNTLGGEAAGIASGDLPGPGNPNGYETPVTVLSELEGGTGIDEGRGMIELIHDLAPEAEIFFYSAFNGYFDFADGIRALADAGCDIIVDDIIYFAEPYFQNGAIAQAVNEVSKGGAAYFSSAGNSGEQSYESDFRAVNPLNVHDFDDGEGVNFFQRVEVASGQQLNLFLQWDQPSPFFTDGPGATDDRLETNLDIFVFDPDSGALIFQTTSLNTDDNIEGIGFTNNGPDSFIFDMAVVKQSGPDPQRIKWVNFGSDLNVTFDTNSSTVVGHANAQRAIAVGAVAFFRVEGFQDRPSTDINGFSSLGGTFLRLNDNGSRKRQPLDTKKPNISATDGTNTTFFGNDIPDIIGGVPVEEDTNPNFFGTSAAAPHAAAVAALMLQANPDLAPNKIRNILQNTASDMDDPLTEGFDSGYDRKTGHGYVNAVKAVRRVIAQVGTEDLELSPVCTDDNDTELRWQVDNPNPFNVKYDFRILGTGQKGELVALPGENFFLSQTVRGQNKARIKWDIKGESKPGRATATFDFDDCDDSDTGKGLVVHPNPIRNYATVSFNSNENKHSYVNVRKLNPTAPIVLSVPVTLCEGENNFHIDFSSLKKGLYILELEGVTKKIIKK
ncbi:hypothetical protein FEE95_05180 [Maribacter algarum]|uniref:T9SS C-terminal target domain-containing protein n=1 Tax=Maribacter algarum (ex Zhang et al. 2020) TaxID=2578118 RepID=A0A5S3PV10_9FLAO|nr:S8 family serine peptidase [Maribacter algarum]TMM58825.1 hypothetical protein FEE95_05180 [Maribacter algarum]